MTTQAVHFENFDVELSQPLDDRQDVILITTSDGRRTVLGDGSDPFSIDEHRQIDRQTIRQAEDRHVAAVLDAAEALGRVAIYCENVEGEDVPIYEYLTGRRN